MTNAETILKLNEALTSLIKAYQELQADNGVLNQRINELEDEVLNLELIKEDLEKSVDELKSNTEDDKNTIYSMLGQIEGILNKTTSSIATVEETKYEEVKKVDDNKAFNPVISQNLLDNSFDHKNETELEPDKKEEENIFAYEQNSTNILNEENSLYKKEDDNKIDLSDGRLDSILGIKQ
jgi:FtsZ-binding cell division protein ZapB